MKYLSLWVFILLTALACNCMAEQKKTLGMWDVHYMVVNTTFLTPEIAKQNGIVRSKFNALVNISVLHAQSQKAQHASLLGEAVNLLGTKKQLNFKKVVEGGAIYYLAVVPFRDREVLRFNVSITQGNTSRTLKFQQSMTVD